jgi:hypothetical protein
LLSWKAFRRSLLFSLAVITISFAAAWIQDSDFFSPIAQGVLAPATGVALFCLLVTLAATILADYLSIAQTRLFARTIENFSDGRITFTMVVADIVMSLTLFIMLFAVARTACYFMIVTRDMPDSITSATYYSPQAVQAMAKDSRVGPVILALRPNEVKSNPYLRELQGILKNDLKSRDAAQRLTALRRESELANVSDSDLFSYRSGWRCLDINQLTAGSLREGTTVFGNTRAIFKNGISAAERLRPELAGKADMSDSVARAAMARLPAGNPNCPLPTLQIVRSFAPADVLAVVGPVDAFMSALALTSLNVAYAIPSKFGGYDAVDLGQEAPHFLAGGLHGRAMPLFGAGRVNIRLNAMADYFDALEYDSSSKAVIPVTTFVASSLVGSAILLVSLVAGWLARSLLAVSSAASLRIDQRSLAKLVFSFCAAATSIFIFIVMVCVTIANALWWLILA